MSYTVPTEYKITTPYLLDAKIKEIQLAMETLSWIEYSFGRAYKGIDEGKTYPEIFQASGSDYHSCMPNDYYNFSFVWAKQPQKLISAHKGIYHYTANLSIVVFYDRTTIGTTLTYNYDELLKYDCMQVLDGVYGCEVTDVYDEIEDVYSLWTKPVEAQYIARHFGALRFDITVDYANKCELTNTY